MSSSQPSPDIFPTEDAPKLGIPMPGKLIKDLKDNEFRDFCETVAEVKYDTVKKALTDDELLPIMKKRITILVQTHALLQHMPCPIESLGLKAATRRKVLQVQEKNAVPYYNAWMKYTDLTKNSAEADQAVIRHLVTNTAYYGLTKEDVVAALNDTAEQSNEKDSKFKVYLGNRASSTYKQLQKGTGTFL